MVKDHANLTRAIRAMDSMARRGEPSPAHVAEQLVSAWRVYQQTGVPQDPGWYAADHALRRWGWKKTEALSHIVSLDPSASGLLVLAGGVGSGRSYAVAHLLWRSCRLFVAGKVQRTGRWLDAGELGLAPMYRDRGDRRELWPEQRARLTLPHLLIIDDLGASGTDPNAPGSAVPLERARELLEERYRSGRLTVVTTNVTATAGLTRLLGGRAHDRAEVVQIGGQSMRTGKLRPSKIPPPEAVTLAQRRASALERVDHALRTGQGIETLHRILEQWLRPPGTTDRAWWAMLDRELDVAERQHAQIGRRLAECVEALAVPARDLEAERRAEEQRMRAEHQAKVERLMSEVDTGAVSG